MKRFSHWLQGKWQKHEENDMLRQHFQICFGTDSGKIVLQWMIDEVYTTVSPSNEAQLLAEHNGQRALVHKILQVLDEAENPEKYKQPIVEV